MKKDRRNVTPDRTYPGHPWPDRTSRRRLAAPARRAPAPLIGDDLDGQLGPDELPDGSEVAMNREAKRHH